MDCKHTCEKCEIKDSGAADKQFVYNKVVELFTALPTASSINRTTTEEEKDAIIVQLNEAMDAFDALTVDEQDLFLKEQLELYKVAMALNDAITGASAVPMTVDFPARERTVKAG